MSGASRLAGNGAELVRERALAGRIQSALERIYGLEHLADVEDYVREDAESPDREVLVVHHASDGVVELGLRLPQLGEETELDTLCQIIEGVSHFVYVADRARARRAATHLELEIQAEVDKWVVLASSMHAFDADRSARLRARLYESVAFAHPAQTELGERYRMANDSAHRFVRRLERRYVDGARFLEMREELRRFFHVGQEEKLRLGRPA